MRIISSSVSSGGLICPALECRKVMNKKTAVAKSPRDTFKNADPNSESRLDRLIAFEMRSF
jgi:hypothetical protein